MVYGKRIKEVRKLLKMKQMDMAEILGVSNSYLSSIESGTRGSNGRLIIKFLNEFDVSALWLYKGVGDVFNDFDDCVYLKSAEVFEPEKEYNVPILKKYVEEELSLPSEKLLYFIIKDEDMSPTLKNGDLVLVDAALNKGDVEGLHLIKIDSERMVRRLVFTPEKIVRFDNNTIRNSTILADSSVEFIGKVVWHGGKI